jgi:hypothetical protein
VTATPKLKIMMKQIVTLFFALFAVVMTAQTVDIAGTPYATIAAAVTAAVDGDVINITGTHTGLVTISNKSITLRGADPATDIIQAAATPSSTGAGTRVITLVALPVAVLNITIENLTIRNGNFNANGGGIFADKIIGLVTLKNLIITNNFTTLNGGGIGLAGSNAVIIDCTIQNNTSTTDGGGIIAAPNNASGISNVVNIKQSLINANTGRNGGGIYINGNAGSGNNYKIEVNVENSTISNNASTSPNTTTLGGGSILSTSALWTTTAGGDGISGNVSLRLIHATVYKNTHIALARAGIVFTGTAPAVTYFSAYNSIIVNDSDLNSRAINFANASTTNVVNCILGGLQNADGTFLDAPARNNTRGRTATNAGLAGILTSLGGATQVLPITAGSIYSGVNWCTAAITDSGVTIPTVDQRGVGFTRLDVQDAGAFEVRSTIWNGSSWTNGVPTLTVEAAIDAPYVSASNGGGFFASKLTILPAGSLTLSPGHNIRLDNELINNSSLGANGFVLENNANLRQNNGVGIVNVGAITVKRNSNPLMRLDYTLWSSPVIGQKFLEFSPLTLNNRFYSYNSDLNIYAEVNPTATTAFGAGKGYLIRMPDNHPTTPTIWTGTFAGIPNNGEVTVPLLTNAIDATKRYNLVGNPYPSPLSIANFVSGNSARITGTLWFWRKTNATVVTTFYPTWNGGTFVGNAEPFGNVNASTPNVIRTGQGFFVQALEAPPGALVFNNFMRTLENTDQFFKTTPENTQAAVTDNDDDVLPEIEKHRIWLHLTNSSGYSYEQAISYIEGGTVTADQYDAQSINVGDILFNSIIPNSTDYYVIQSRPLPFDPNDVVPLSVKITTPGTYQITVNNKDGLFANPNQAIFLTDTFTNTCVNLNNGAYSFTATAGTFNTRFNLRYINNLLATQNPDFNASDVLLYLNNTNELVIQTTRSSIKAVAVYDVSGRLLLSKNNLLVSNIAMNVDAFSNQILLVQITDVNGIITTKKIIR